MGVIAVGIVLSTLAGVIPAAGVTPGTQLFIDGFDAPQWPNDLITNEYATYNPGDPQAPVSAKWRATSGSLFSRASKGWTGYADSCAPDRYSENCTGSAAFRLHTKRFDFGNVKVTMWLRMNALSTSSTSALDGAHIWLRYQSETELYVASVSRRDGQIVLKKKCNGGTTNGGTYHTLAEASGYSTPQWTWTKVGAWVANQADGSVRLRLYRNGAWVLDVTDRGVGCSPIRSAGAVGIRADNANAEFEDFTVDAI